MRIQFTTSEITAYSQGNLVFENTGEAFECPAGCEKTFLAAMADVDGKMVNIFKPADEVKTIKKKGDK